MIRRALPVLSFLSVLVLSLPLSSSPLSAESITSTTGTLTGTVTNVIGEPLDNIEVSVYLQIDGDWVYHQFTNSEPDGSYSLELTAATYRILFRDWSGVYAYEYYDDVAHIVDALDVVVGDGSTTVIDGTLDLAGHISGTLTGYQGQSVQYGFVAVYEHGLDEEQVIFVQQLSNATYDIGGLPTGNYAVRFSGQVGGVYDLEWYDNATIYQTADAVAVTRGFTTDNINAVLGEPITGAVSGSVTDGNGTTLSGIEMQLYHDSGSGWSLAAWQNSAGDGSFAFTDLDDGVYRLQAVDRSQTYAFEYVPDGLTLSDAADIVVSGAPVTVPTVVMEPAARIQGSLTDPSGAPLENTLVFVFQTAPEQGDVVFLASADSGSYDIGGLRTGDYIVQFSGRQGLDSYSAYYDDANEWAGADPVTVTNGATTTGIDGILGFAAGGTIAGSIADRYGRAFDFATVEAYANDGSMWTLVRSEEVVYGETDYEIALPVDTYRLRFVAGSWLFPDDPLVEWYDDALTVNDATDIALDFGATVHAIDSVLGDNAAGSIAGNVTDESGAPLAGIEVYVYDRTLAALYDQTAVTDAAGQFTIDGLWPDEYVVEFYDPQLTFVPEFYDDSPDAQTAERIPVNETSVTGITATLASATEPLAGSISGVVSADNDAQPILGIRVTATSAAEDFAIAYTDSNGFYRLRNLAPLTQTVRFVAPDGNFVTEYFDDVVDEANATAVDVQDGLAVSGIDAGLAAAGRIRGTITDIYGNDFDFINATAYAWQDGAWTVAPGQLSYDGIDYELSGVPAGVYRVSLFGSSFGGNGLSEFYDDAPTIDLATDVTVVAGQVTDDISAVLGSGPGGAISGTVTAPDGSPLADIAVQATDREGFVSREATTAVDGTYTLTNVYNGIYYVEFSDPAAVYPGEFYNDAPTLTFATPISVQDDPVNGIDAILDGGNGGPGGGLITGLVTDDATGDPLAGVLVHCYDEEGFFFGACETVTTADGTYQLGGNLPSDAYTVRFSHPTGSYATEWYDDTFYQDEAAVISVTIGTTVSAIDAALTPAGAISGNVTDTDGQPFPLTTVTAFVQDGAEWRFFKSVSAEYEQSDYMLDGLPAGTYRIKFRGAFLFGNGIEEFYNDQPTLAEADDVVVTVGQTITGIDAVLGTVQPGGISGSVTDAGGMPIGGIVVRLFDADGFSEDEIITQADGSYLFEDLYNGTYVVQFADLTDTYLTVFYEDAATFDAATPITVSDAVVSGIDATLAQPGHISGTVLDLAGQPLDFVRVTVYRQLDGAWESVGMVFADPAGAYAFDGLLPSVYRVEFTGYRLVPGQTPQMYVEFWDDAPDLASATDLTLADGGMLTAIDAMLGNWSPDGLIGGLVRDQYGARAADANVTVYWHNGEEWTLFGRTTTNDNGIYRLRTLADGSYAICFGMGNDGFERYCHSDDGSSMPSAIELHDEQNRQRIDITLVRQ